MKPNENYIDPAENHDPKLNSENPKTTPTPSSIELWTGLEFYFNMGLSMIWSRIETEIVNGIEKTPKTPIGRWKAAQKDRFTLKELSRIMHGSSVQIAPTIVCGQVSGNLEIIDVDVKHWIGIDVIYFSEIKSLYPDLFKRLRIHRTAS